MSGTKLSASNSSLRNALDSLKMSLSSSLGDKFQCTDTFAQMEATISCIEQKLGDLVLDPSRVIASAEENFAVELPVHNDFQITESIVS